MVKNDVITCNYFILSYDPSTSLPNTSKTLSANSVKDQSFKRVSAGFGAALVSELADLAVVAGSAGLS